MADQNDLLEGKFSKPFGLFLSESPKSCEADIAAQIFQARDRCDQIT